MRLIDADELKKKLKLWAFNNVTTTSPTFDFVTEFDIDECPTVCDIEQIRQEFKNEAEMYKLIDRQMANVWSEALKIINKYTEAVKNEKHGGGKE